MDESQRREESSTNGTPRESYIFRKAINISRALCSDTQLHIGGHNTITTREEANCSIAEHYTTSPCVRSVPIFQTRKNYIACLDEPNIESTEDALLALESTYHTN